MRAFRSGLAALTTLVLAARPCVSKGAPPVAPAVLAPELTAPIGGSGPIEVLVMLAPPRESVAADLTARRRAVADARATVLSSVDPVEVVVHDRFVYASGFTATVSAVGLRQLLQNPAVIRIEPARYGHAALAQSVPQIRADAVHRRDDLGQGITVAVLDTGVDVTHPDLADSIVAEECFCSDGCCPDGSGRQSGSGSAATRAVHGIHVTGIIVSKGIVAPPGVAPAAKVVSVKVLGDDNRGLLSDWIQALDWIATMRPDVQAINMSLVSDGTYPGTCDAADGYTMAFAQEIGVLRAHGTLTLAASGNGGETSRLAAPACVGAAVAVGAVTKTDRIWSASDTDSKLDVLAPGVSILSTGLQQGTAILSGTSMATPHVTGTVALVRAFAPALSADEIEDVLKATGVRLFDARDGLTLGRINALAALNAAMITVGPLSGGGSRENDCLVEWDVAGASIAAIAPVPHVVCHDNDPSCDADQISGQCTFQVTACFNVPDGRLPHCRTAVPIVDYGLLRVPTGGAANARAIGAALPALPIDGADVCSTPMMLVFPVGNHTMRFFATSAAHDTDYDRLRFSCLPAQE